MKAFIKDYWLAMLILPVAFIMLSVAFVRSLEEGTMRKQCKADGNVRALIDGVPVCLKAPVTIINMDDK